MPVPRIARLQFESVVADAEGAVAIDFRPDRPLAFTAGQHALWQIPGGGVRPFTIASAPEEELVTLGTDLASGTRLKRALGSLAPGDPVRLLGPLSSFTLETTASALVMLAQGVGVTPFRSMLRHLAMTQDRTETTLVHVGARHAFRADTEDVVGHGSYPESRGAFAGEVKEAVEANRGATFLVSGSPSFVADTTRALREQAVDASAIRRDRFWGAHTATPEQLALVSA